MPNTSYVAGISALLFSFVYAWVFAQVPVMKGGLPLVLVNDYIEPVAVLAINIKDSNRPTVSVA
jgi:hypothetical protein